VLNFPEETRIRCISLTTRTWEGEEKNTSFVTSIRRRKARGARVPARDLALPNPLTRGKEGKGGKSFLLSEKVVASSAFLGKHFLMHFLSRKNSPGGAQPKVKQHRIISVPGKGRRIYVELTHKEEKTGISRTLHNESCFLSM